MRRLWRGRFPTYGLLLGLFVAAYIWKISGFAPLEPVSSHVSNFALTGGALTLACTPKAFVDVGRRRRALTLCMLFAALNLVVEVLLGLGDFDSFVNEFTDGFNTADPLDAVGGLVAVATVLVTLPRRKAPRSGGEPEERRRETAT